MDPYHLAVGAAARRKDIASLLRKSEDMVRALLESASQAILGVDRHGRIVLANPKTEEMFGYSRQELLGSSIEMLLPERSREVHARERAGYFARPKVRPMGIGMELAGRRRDGAEFPVEVSLSYVQIEEGIFGIAFVTDITERKRLEQQLFHSQKLEAIGRLAGGVAHDFNNLLTIIDGYNRMMLEQLPPAHPMRGFAEEIAKAADRAAALTRQLLAFSRRQIMQPRVIDVNALITTCGKMLRRLIGEDIELILELKASAANIKADPGQIEQAIFNLAVNSRDAMPDGGRLVIETSEAYLDQAYAKSHLGVQPGEYVMIAVSDTGHGMDAETQRHVFEPFFTTKEHGKGTGLGLATVYGIVKQTGGEIWLYSEPGKGTTFKLYFPKVNEAAAHLPPAAPAPARAEGAETVLVVEDDDAVRDLVAVMLQQLGYHVLSAADACQAIEISNSHRGPIPILVTDVVMPHMSGRQLAAELERSRPEMKVLYLSGYTENAVVHHGGLEPGVEFLAKPFSQGELACKIRSILDRR